MKKLWFFLKDEGNSRALSVLIPVIIASVAGIWAIYSFSSSQEKLEKPIVNSSENNIEPTNISPELKADEFHRYGDHLFGYAKLVTINGEKLVGLEFSNGQRRKTIVKATVVCKNPEGKILLQENVTVALDTTLGMGSAVKEKKDIFLECLSPNYYSIIWGV